MISLIFEFLKFKDRKVASTVCWSWYDASIQPRFLKKEVISLKDKNKMHNILNIYTKSLLPFFSFRIWSLGEQMKPPIDSINKNCWDWVNTIWPLLAPKVIYLEFLETGEFRGEILPAFLNVTQQLKVLKIRRLNYSEKVLCKINRLQSLEELELEFVYTFNLDKTKLLEVIPETLRKLSVKCTSMESKFIIDGLINLIKVCSSHLESLELCDVDLTYKVMESMVNLDMKLKKFSLLMINPMDCDNAPEIISVLLKTQWPLVDLELCANTFTYEHVLAITNTFKDLEKLSVTGICERSFETMAGISGSSFEALSRLTNSIDSLSKLKSLYIGVKR